MSSVNAQNSDHDTPLHWAVILENTKMLEFLLCQPDIDPNIRNKNDNSPLMLACLNSSAASVEILLRFNEKKGKIITRASTLKEGDD
eukprot:CAMPEP_0176393766 /NCGR_PEP_ID=MMETSP0126-20121128/42013_1 /TAXON_ID=141414 ORGANISM="Strombidinopsis acuminatum, Strain SPMC142" /NCGR_SAMPLE_ID=MMETSP0126 /ASSEMBLY_ACC=CAM_ASM_000229 /LENGTH=86 /DNA_ID=CAMNT_0017765525 /DNA_START=469 /DNA_END=729 /DNA_ORIENTATION=+